jgi:hypothetical protein
MRQVKFSEYDMQDGEVGCFILQKHVFTQNGQSTILANMFGKLIKMVESLKLAFDLPRIMNSGQMVMPRNL